MRDRLTFLRDLRYAWRGLYKHPSFFVIALVGGAARVLASRAARRRGEPCGVDPGAVGNAWTLLHATRAALVIERASLFGCGDPL